MDEAATTGSFADAAAAIRGDREALRVLWESHRRWAAAILLAYKPREAELDDLLQDVAMTVVSKISGLKEPTAFKPWLRRICINAARAAARGPERSRRRPWPASIGDGGGDWQGLDAEPGQAIAERERAGLVLGTALELPEGYREPLLLRCVRGMSYRRIGRVMGLPETTIETRIARGRRMLRERLAAAGEAEVRAEGSL